MKAQTLDTQTAMTPDTAIAALQEGNKRFLQKQMLKRDLINQVTDTSTGQYPFATVLSCIDSRVSAELVFDQGIGDIFSVRIAGNFANEDILGSMEFATKLAGSKLIVVLGHTACGAIKGACDDAKLGNLTSMLAKLKPAVKAVTEPTEASERTSANASFVNEVARQNVLQTIENIKAQSETIAELEANGDIKIVGAMYNVQSGEVDFY